MKKIAGEIIASGGLADTAIVDAFDEKAIDQHLQQMVSRAGTVDISFNAVGVDVVQNVPLTEISAEDFVKPITLTMQTRFMTAIAAVKVMMKQKSGVILSLTATPGGIGYPHTGGFGPACSGVESFSRTLASELGVYGIRVVNIRSGGSPDSRVFKNAIDTMPDVMDPILKKWKLIPCSKNYP
ncbi:SDR family oxidoreductase [Mucilaginibacter sp. UC70_90]